MKKFLISTIVFGIPFLFIAVFLVYIDPYNIIRIEKDSKIQQLKFKIAYHLHYPLYQLQHFDNAPTDIIILGDSRAKALDKKVFEANEHQKITNLAYGGGTIPEVIETFWHITEKRQLQKVYIGLSFNLYNALNNKNRVIEANEIRSSYASYLSSKYCIKSSFLIAESMLTNEQIEIGKPPMNRESFWEYQLNYEAEHYLKNYVYPEEYFKGLHEISAYCTKNNIKLVFFIPPTHVDLQEMIGVYGLEKEYERFLSDLKLLKNPIYDFNFSNEITLYKDNYGDPLHFNDSISSIISRIIVTGKKKSSEENFIREY